MNENSDAREGAFRRQENFAEDHSLNHHQKPLQNSTSGFYANGHRPQSKVDFWVVIDALTHRWHWLAIGAILFGAGFFELGSWYFKPKFTANAQLLRDDTSSEFFKQTLMTPETFAGLFHRRTAPIKALLLNQRLLHGVGNIYADESLFRSGVRPRRRASTLTLGDLARLHTALQEVLEEAIAAGGSSVSDYVDADGREGFFQLQHRVYGRAGEPCLVCRSKIKKIVVAGRGTHYCPTCQR